MQVISTYIVKIYFDHYKESNVQAEVTARGAGLIVFACDKGP